VRKIPREVTRKVVELAGLSRQPPAREHLRSAGCEKTTSPKRTANRGLPAFAQATAGRQRMSPIRVKMLQNRS